MVTAEAPVCTKEQCSGVEPALNTTVLRRCGTAFAAGPRHIWDSGLTCSFLACLIFSFSALFVKLTGGRVPVLEVCLVRSSISAGLSFILMYVSGLDWRLWFGKRAHLRLLFLRGCCGACSMTTYYVALFMLPLGDAVTINLIGPPVTAVFARLLLKEPLGYRGGAGCLISLLGVVLVARPPFLFGGGDQEWARARSIGTAAGVLSAVLGGGSSMTIRLIGGSEPAAVIALWFHCATMLLSVIPLAAGFPNKAVLLSGVDGSLMLGVASTSFVAQLLSTRGLQRCQAAKAAAMGFTQVVYSHIMGAIFFGDKLTIGGFFGTLLILSGVLLVTLRSAKPSSSTAAAGATVCPGVPVAGGTVAAPECKETDSDAAALLSDHIASHIAAGKHGDEDRVAAVAVIKLRADSSILSAKQRPESPPGAEGEQAQLLTANMDDSAAVEDDGESATDPGLLAQIAASAAAALGGELCPAASAASALDLSRQVSRQLATSRAVSQMSRQPSQYLFGSPSAFMTAPGIPGLSALPWDWQGLGLTSAPQQPPAQQHPPQESLGTDEQQAQQRRSQAPASAEAQVGGTSPGLRQALLRPESDSATNSPERRSPARLEQRQEQE